ncbi:MAG: cell division protein FtsZ [Bacteroidetes bacterium]|nr:cell division protein FtsZ [Bacteroidota bacterium]
MLKFDAPKNQSSIIKVIGVGGGGSNAVTHMFRQGIKGVDFMICNTDAQAMESSPVPIKIQLGANLTGGLGAGAVPSVGKNAALENIQDIRDIFSKETKMLFITAGLGGGTGTGAAPVIASISKEAGILTVGIVTIPFSFEGRKRKQHAEQGIAEMKKYVDALVIISNDKLRELYGDQRLSAAFGHADDVLTTAAKGIAEIITVTGYINVDFEDVRTVMKDSGVAIMGNGKAHGENRALVAVEQALNSPLLNDNDIEGANNLLLYITSGIEEITMDEVTEITDYIQRKTKSSTEVIWGNGTDEALEDNISITIIATGFDEEHRKLDTPTERTVTVKPLYGSEPIIRKEIQEIQVMTVTEEKLETQPVEPILNLIDREPVCEENATETEETVSPQRIIFVDMEKNEQETTFIHEFQLEETSPVYKPAVNSISDFTTPDQTQTIQRPALVTSEMEPSLEKKLQDRVMKLKALSEKLKNHVPIENNLVEIESVPAYKRRNIDLPDVTPSSEPQAPKYILSGNGDKPLEIKKENPFLHKDVD